MREFLSQNSVEFEDRNIAKEPHWREDLKALTGEIVVPVLVVNGEQVTGLDEVRMAAALGLENVDFSSNRDGLAAPPELAALSSTPDDPTSAALTHFVQRLQREMEFNNAAHPHRHIRAGGDGHRARRHQAGLTTDQA